ncbi:intradiol ring-cleavage dioxygenase [Sphingomonas carotinifaciens]|nr:intradiol ring-cleavage dioxygenase [Sphingomonas carotinifaciens]MBB4087519.1 protocatechuate 3,4-dioxygenase beta subunit [Sphingomonas carotinifaciens]SDF90139.1 Protocatechuate 3,4-dioxygenase beta subunit [Sphingomonas carotinifaciens]
MDHHDDDHDRGLSHDLQVIGEKIVERRRALAWLASVGGAAIVAGSAAAQMSRGSVTPGGVITVGGGGRSTPTPTATPAPTSTPTPTATSSAGCLVDPTETAGPYPGDGTNTSSGSTSNVLTTSGIVRSDIRSSFISSTAVAGGVLVRITLTVVNVNATCAPLSGYAVYLWHADRQGRYSLYSAPAESYLRGVQVTDANGQVTFTTIFPACYDGRWPHMHFEVFSGLAAATSGRYAVLTSQLAMPSAICSAVYADTTTYPTSASIFKGVKLSTDNVFGDNTTAQIAQQTPTFAGSTSAGYTAAAVIGIAR